jgi:hypothetical protein
VSGVGAVLTAVTALAGPIVDRVLVSCIKSAAPKGYPDTMESTSNRSHLFAGRNCEFTDMSLILGFRKLHSV